MSGEKLLDGASWLKSGATALVLNLLNGNGEEARVVGGAVRNALLNLPIGDVDIATTALPEEVLRRARAAGIKSVPTGIEHGTVTLVVDSHPLEVTTLREAEEEIGLEQQFIDPIGYLDLYGTSFGFRILPTVARVRPGFKLRVNQAEVDDAFEVPLAFLMNPANHQLHSKQFRGVERTYYAMPYEERYIWGATAGILRVLYDRIWTS